ncbi:multidrug efflux SMR transporter [uncultured Cohaesibacter sp.]|uniref:DMT family transporter n=1 Tax=uncultured Cohaesibacter sp. TaxID=1002546 RepID=UPI002930C11F|nr:multidrug efflux SMR transporter [uncultured Cohaesibacter sp.]
MSWLYLAIAIVAEVIGTSAVAASDGFTRPLQSGLGILALALSFFVLSLALRTIPVGIAYSLWSGCGIVLISIFGFVALKQILDAPALIGIGLIMSGVIVINLFSNTTHS